MWHHNINAVGLCSVQKQSAEIHLINLNCGEARSVQITIFILLTGIWKMFLYRKKTIRKIWDQLWLVCISSLQAPHLEGLTEVTDGGENQEGRKESVKMNVKE